MTIFKVHDVNYFLDVGVGDWSLRVLESYTEFPMWFGVPVIELGFHVFPSVCLTG